MFVDVGVQTNLTNQELNKTINDLPREKKILQQKLIRRDNRVNIIWEMLHLLKENNLIEEIVEDIFKNQFNSSLPFIHIISKWNCKC